MHLPLRLSEPMPSMVEPPPHQPSPHPSILQGFYSLDSAQELSQKPLAGTGLHREASCLAMDFQNLPARYAGITIDIIYARGPVKVAHGVAAWRSKARVLSCSGFASKGSLEKHPILVHNLFEDGHANAANKRPGKQVSHMTLIIREVVASKLYRTASLRNARQSHGKFLLHHPARRMLNLSQRRKALPRVCHAPIPWLQRRTQASRIPALIRLIMCPKAPPASTHFDVQVTISLRLGICLGSGGQGCQEQNILNSRAHAIQAGTKTRSLFICTR